MFNINILDSLIIDYTFLWKAMCISNTIHHIKCYFFPEVKKAQVLVVIWWISDLILSK